MSLTRHARFALRVVSGLRHRPWQVRAGASRRWKASTTAAESMDGPEPPNGFLFNEKVSKEVFLFGNEIANSRKRMIF